MKEDAQLVHKWGFRGSKSYNIVIKNQTTVQLQLRGCA